MACIFTFRPQPGFEGLNVFVDAAVHHHEGCPPTPFQGVAFIAEAESINPGIQLTRPLGVTAVLQLATMVRNRQHLTPGARKRALHAVVQHVYDDWQKGAACTLEALHKLVEQHYPNATENEVMIAWQTEHDHRTVFGNHP